MMTEEVKRTWALLSSAAIAHAATPDDLAVKKGLADAADAYIKARNAARAGGAAKPAAGGASGVVVPFGRSKGTPIEQADAKDLKWVAARLVESIDNPEKARWKDENARVLAAIEAVLGAR